MEVNCDESNMNGVDGNKKQTKEQVYEKHLKIAKDNSHLNAYITYCGEEINVLAKNIELNQENKLNKETYLDNEIRIRTNLDNEFIENVVDKQSESAVSCMPISIKDNFLVKGTPTTCASRLLDGCYFDINATVVDKLLERNAVIIGKANMDEFAMGCKNIYSAYGSVLNPINNDYICGGSSGGSACSVAMGSVRASLGSDTGGSVRQPAGLCGVVGFKGTLGRISRYGLFPLAESLDCVGIIADNVDSTLKVFNTICGVDVKDSRTIFEKNDVVDVDDVFRANRKLRVAVICQSYQPHIVNEEQEAVRKCARMLVSGGYYVSEISLFDFDKISSYYRALCCFEAYNGFLSFNDLFRHSNQLKNVDIEDIVKNKKFDCFNSEVISRLNYGESLQDGGMQHDKYLKAKGFQTKFNEYMDRVFNEFDILIYPTVTHNAIRFDESIKYDDTFEVIANLISAPSLSLPFGFDSNGFPLSVQIMGKKLGEKDVFNIAYQLESQLDNYRKSK